MADGSDPIGRIFDGRYQVVALIGRGGMGTVYRAVHVAMNQVVALKVLHRELSADEVQVQRFYQEARASSRLRHPNTIKVFDFGRSDEGHLYLAMEFLEGETLTQLLRRERVLPARRALAIARQVAKSLAEAHRSGLVHRDLKPDNIFLTKIYGEEDFVKVLDFGIAKFLASEPQAKPLTQMGLVCGTPLYLSPEQALGRTLDGRSDLYSLGVILYEMLSGAPPFRAETPVSLVMRHIHATPPPLQGPQPIPPAVRDLVLSLLEKDRDRRPPTAEALIRSIEDLMADAPAPGSGPSRASAGKPPPPGSGSAARVERDPAAGGASSQEASPAGRSTSPRRDFEAPTTVARRVATGGRRTAARAVVPSSDPAEQETVLLARSNSVIAEPLPVRTVPQRTRDSSTAIEPPTRVPLPDDAARRSSRAPSWWRWAVAVVGLAILTGVGIAVVLRGDREPAPPPGSSVAAKTDGRSAAPPAEPAPEPRGSASAEQRPAPAPAAASQAPAVSGGPAEAASSRPPAAEPRIIGVRFESVPDGAQVLLDGHPLGNAPLVVTVREGDAPLSLRFRLEGHEDRVVTLDPTQAVREDRLLQKVVLERKAPAVERPAPAVPKPPAVHRPAPARRPKSSPGLKWE